MNCNTSRHIFFEVWLKIAAEKQKKKKENKIIEKKTRAKEIHTRLSYERKCPFPEYNIAHPNPSPSKKNNGLLLVRKLYHSLLTISMGLTVGRKLKKSLAYRLKSHHPIYTLLAAFHDSSLSMSSFILEAKKMLFLSRDVCVCGGGGGGVESLEI